MYTHSDVIEVLPSAVVPLSATSHIRATKTVRDTTRVLAWRQSGQPDRSSRSRSILLTSIRPRQAPDLLGIAESGAAGCR